MDDKLYRFLIVNENSIQNSDLFTDCLELKKIDLKDLYQEIKRKHAGVLFFLHHAEELLKKESESLPTKIKNAERELDVIGNEHVRLISEMGKKNGVGDEFLKMAVKMYATYELESCGKVEYAIFENLFNSIEKVHPSLNDDLKELLESYKKVYEKEVSLENKKTLEDNVNCTLRNIKLLHKYYISTAGFDERYIKKEHKQTIEKIYNTINTMFNLLCASGNNISVLAIVDEMNKYEINNYIRQFARIEYAKNFRVYGDGRYLKDFIDYINREKESREETIEEFVDEEYREAILEENSNLLIKYKKIISRWKKAGISLETELDIESEIRKVDAILKQYYEDKDSKNLEDEQFKKKVLKHLSKEEQKEYIVKLQGLQINKVKKIADEIVLMEKQADFISKYYVEKQGIKTKELLELFKKVDDTVDEVYKTYVSPKIWRTTSGVMQNRRARKGLPLEKVEKLYSVLFSSEPDGVDLDERMDKKNHFYVCNFKPEVGIMTFPYANRTSGVQSNKYSRAAIIYDMSIHDRIVCENRGASWASDPDERTQSGEKIKVYTGNRLVINNKTHNLQEVISKAIFTETEDIEKIEKGSISYLSSHKFDYRKGSLALHFKSVTSAHEKNRYYGLNEIAWISDDNIDISKYKAICYMDSAESLKNFIEKL